MSLGFARDSFLNLQELAHQNDERTTSVPRDGGDSGEEIGMDLNGGDVDDIGLLLDNEEEEAAPTKTTMISLPATTQPPTPARPSITVSDSKWQERPKEKPADAPPKEITPYAGFQSDYAEYASYYDNDPYAVEYGGYAMPGVQTGEKKNIFCCLFAPWNADKKFDSSSEQGSESEERVKQEVQAPASGVFTKAAPTVAAYNVTNEEEKKAEVFSHEPRDPRSNEEKVAKDVTVGASEEKTEDPASDETRGEAPVVAPKGLSTEEGEQAKKIPVKGILKKCVHMHRSSSTDAGKRDDSSAASTDNRRHMFPTYSREAADSEPKKSTKLTFAPMARVVTVSSRKEMAFIQKTQIWWQRTDFDDFKKTGRIIAKAMLEGGSQIWLTSNDAWGKKRAQPTRRMSVESSGGSEDELDTDYERALHKYSGGLQQEAGEQPKESESSVGNKWWCKFGHSRRGLEHIASMEEGRQRQRNVNTATKAVIDEQRRQRMNRMKDAYKLANIAHQYTSWARDLALAAGAADAEAVRVNFKNDAKCRSHYLVTGVKAKESKVTNFTDSKRFSFIAGHIAAEVLDANTSSSMKTKRVDAKQRQVEQSTAPGGADGSRSQPSREDAPTPPLADETDEMEEAIHDPAAAKENMAKKAAGFAANEDEKVDMSAVLSGMGSVTVRG